MRRIIPTCLVAACLAAGTASAQDATIKSKTKIKADDGKAMTLTGCLAGGPASFTLSNVVGAGAHEIAGVPHERTSPTAVGTSGVVTAYDLTPRDGVDLAGHVGERVEIAAVMVEPAKKGDHDAKVEIHDNTKVKVDDAPDHKVETKTKAEIERGPTSKLAVLTVRTVSPSCQ